MDKNYEKKYSRLEFFHWWTVTRREMIGRLLKKEGLAKDTNILEIGCSVGIFLNQLKLDGYTNAYGVDISDEAISQARESGLVNVEVRDATSLGANRKYQTIIASDVLEHIEDESKALSSWYDVLNPGGALIIFLPAHKYFWSQHDEINHHFRRYNKKYLKKVLEKAGFKIERISYWNLLLFFVKLLVVVFDRIFFRSRDKKHDQFIEINPLVNKMLIGLLKLENKYTENHYLPFGVSVFAIARKEKI